MASNFRAAQLGRTGGREYTRDHATPAWEALEELAGELEGGEAVAFSSGMAAVSAVLDLVPAGALVVAPTDCYMGVHVLLADGQQQVRWRVRAGRCHGHGYRRGRGPARGPGVAGVAHRPAA
jgi:cystathionine gamma-synthase